MDPTQRRQLKQLKKHLTRRAPVRPSPQAEPAAEDERHLFQQAMHGVRPLKQERISHPARPCAPWPRQQATPSSAEEPGLSDYWPWENLEIGEELLFSRPGINLDTLKKLRRGHWPVEAELDLHGHSSDSARHAVIVFLQRCRHAGLRCVRIIHGKGLSSNQGVPILKLRLKNWLVQHSDVLAFCQARPADGGSGAALLLLKSQRKLR